ncbi:helix-turn-helix domain-containing protein [Aurantimonas sp. VKM B-3413]|uniref:helix-turn-helix domain-containing protein n=1 Tax=Aurantimonas sp. VKM B-3413 TaxID=2779401 RepID=UPI00351CFBCA
MSDDSIDQRIAVRLRALRSGRGWSLDELAGLSGVSRATLSRLEKAEVSATASVLGRLGAAYGLTTSRLLSMVEDDFTPQLDQEQQAVWVDPETGFRRRSVSPPAAALAGEVIEGTFAPGRRIAYEAPARGGLEHHLVLIEGRLSVTIEDRVHDLTPGDCLRYRLFGPSAFETPDDCGARYLLFMV